MFDIDVTADIDFGMPTLYTNFSSWYENHYENLKCFYTLNDTTKNLTGLDVNASHIGSYNLMGEI